MEMARLCYARTSGPVEDTKLLLNNDATILEEPVGGYGSKNRQLSGDQGVGAEGGT